MLGDKPCEPSIVQPTRLKPDTSLNGARSRRVFVQEATKVYVEAEKNPEPRDSKPYGGWM
jgi:hypothetical protein